MEYKGEQDRTFYVTDKLVMINYKDITKAEEY